MQFQQRGKLLALFQQTWSQLTSPHQTFLERNQETIRKGREAERMRLTLKSIGSYVISIKQEGADPFTQIGLSCETDNYLIRKKKYKTGNNLGETKMCGTGVGNTPTMYPEV